MKKINLLSLVLALFLSVPAFSSNCFAFENISYDITAQFDPQDKTVLASETVEFKNNTGSTLNEIYFRVYPNHRYSAKEKKRLYEYAGYFKINPYPQGFDPGDFRIRSVRLGKEALKYEFEGADQTLLKIPLSQPFKNGDTLKIEIEFSLKVPHRIGRYGWHNGIFALNRWYPLLGVFDVSGWHKDPDYLLHMPYLSEAAVYRVRLNVPQDFVVALGCDQVTEELTSDGRKHVLATSAYPLRELSLAFSKDYKIYELDADGVKVRSYYLKRDEARARKAAEFAADQIKFSSQRLGAYPYKQFTIAPVYLGYGGSQNAGIIFIDTRAYQMPEFLIRYFDFLVSHETGHQWWYNMVGSDEYRQLWLDEGINSYWTQSHLEDKYGPEGKIIDMPRWVEHFIPNPTFSRMRDYQYLYFSRRGFDQPVMTELPSFYEPSLIFTIGYGKGAAVARMLAKYVGEEKFSEILKTYFNRYRFKNTDIGDFIRVCEEVTGEDMDWFFNEWLFGKGLCDYALQLKKDKLILKKPCEVTMPVETKLEFQDGREEVVSSQGQEEGVLFESTQDKKLKSAALDYEHKILDVDRVNNNAPRKLDVRLVPVYLGLYDMPLFLKEDAYSWITGPSFSSYGAGVRTSFQKPDDYIVTLTSQYQLSSPAFISSAGFEKTAAFSRYIKWGAEFFNRDSKNEDDDDLKWYKLYIRRELGLANGVFEPASHLTAYFLHNWSLGRSGFLGSPEKAQGLRYRQREESIFGVEFYRSKAGPLPDPSTGYKFLATEEIGGHVLGGSDAFLRSVLELDRYFQIIGDHKLALRLKHGAGHPKDKYLFYLGSDTDLRGYNYKDIQGSSMLLASFEYRFPLFKTIDARFPYNFFTLDELQGVLFFDTGSAWFDEFNEPGFKKDAGFGLRFYFNVAGAAERFALRIDFATPLREKKRDTHVWVGINHAF